MSMDLHVYGYREPDEEWHKMQAAWDACVRAGVKVPDEVLDYFEGEAPDFFNESLKVELPGLSVREHNDVGEFGYTVYLSHVPKGVKVLRFIASF